MSKKASAFNDPERLRFLRELAGTLEGFLYQPKSEPPKGDKAKAVHRRFARLRQPLGKIFPRYENLKQSLFRQRKGKDLEGGFREYDHETGDFRRQWVFLRAIEDYSVYPLVSASWNFDRLLPEVRIRLLLLSFSDREENPLSIIGFRFEMPEGEGAHQFYHAQMIESPQASRTDNDQSVVLLCWKDWQGWKPTMTSQPSFPLAATEPVELLKTVMATIYGSGRKGLSEGQFICEAKYFRASRDGNLYVFKTLGSEDEAQSFLMDRLNLKAEECDEKVYFQQPEDRRFDLDESLSRVERSFGKGR